MPSEIEREDEYDSYGEFEIKWKKMKRAYYERGNRLTVQAYLPVRGPAFMVADIEPEYTSQFTYRTIEEADIAAQQHALENEYDYCDLQNNYWRYDYELQEWVSLSNPHQK